MTKFKIGDIVTGTEKPEGMYKIIKDTGKDYEVRCIAWGRITYTELQPHYIEVPYNCVTRPTLEQTILLTKLGLI